MRNCWLHGNVECSGRLASDSAQDQALLSPEPVKIATEASLQGSIVYLRSLLKGECLSVQGSRMVII